jgi:hypothetical protein
LESITIPDTVTDIYQYAFLNCTALKSITIPNSVTSMGTYVFSGCTSLTSATLPNIRQNIMSHMFYNCQKLTDITLPPTVTAIRDYAFYECRALKDLEFPVPLQIIEAYAFYNNDTLTTITIPKNVTSLGNYAFYDCDALTSLTFSDSGKLASLGTYAFYGSELLADIDFGYGLKTIPDSAFRLCPALQNLTLPESLATIAANAFAECTGLTEVYIPPSVTSIQSNSFSYPARMTIYGVAGSYAQTYAEARGITFVATTAKPIPISSDANLETLQINQGTLTPSFRESITDYTATVPNNVSRLTVTATASHPKATVSGAGQVNLKVGANTIEITVKAEDGTTTKKYTLVVTRRAEDDIQLESISLSRTSATVNLNDTIRLAVRPYPSNAPVGPVEWRSYNPGIATVDGNGLVTGIAPGLTTIEASTVLSNGETATVSCEITVTVAAQAITITPAPLKLYVGDTETLTAEISPPEAAQPLEWQSTNEAVATVAATDDATAEVTGLASGSATIYAATADGSVAGSCLVTVERVRGSIALNRSRLVLNDGATDTVKARLDTPDAPLNYALFDGKTYQTLALDDKLTIDDTAPAVGKERPLTVTPKAGGDGQYVLRVSTADGAWAECRVDVFTTATSSEPDYPTYRLDPQAVTVSTAQKLNVAAAQFGLWPNADAGTPVSLMAEGVVVQFRGGAANPLNSIFAFAPSCENAIDLQLKTAANIASKYQDSLEIVLPNGDTVAVAGRLTISVNNKPPSLKADNVTVNVFYDDRTAPLAISGGAVESLRVAGSNSLAWANIKETESGWVVAVDDIPSKASGSLKLEAQLAGWEGWHPVSVKLNRVFAPPALKLASNKISLYMNDSRGTGNTLVLQPKAADATLAELGVTGVQIDPGNAVKAGAFKVKNYSFNIRTGGFVIEADRAKAESALKGTLPLAVSVRGATKYTAKLNASVSLVKADAAVKLKASRGSVTLNPNLALGESVDIALSTNIAGFDLTAWNYSDPLEILVYDSKDRSKKDINGAAGKITALLSGDGRTLTVAVAKDAEFGKDYKVVLTLPNVNSKNPVSPTLTITVKTAKKSASANATDKNYFGAKASLGVKGKIDVSTGAKATITAKLANYNGGLTGIPEFEVTPPKSVGSGKWSAGDAAFDDNFLFRRVTDKSWTVELKPGGSLAPGTYKIAIKRGYINSADSVATKAANLVVAAAKPKVALSAKRVTLYDNDPASRAVVVFTLPNNFADIRDVTLKGARLANGAANPSFPYVIRQLDSNTYALMLDPGKDASVLAGAKKSAGVTLEIWLKGNAGAKPLTTAKVTVAVNRG